MTKDNPRQGMAELLAQQRTGRPLTPSEAARQRRSGRRGSAPASAGTGPSEDRPLADSQPSEDLPPTEEALAHERQATRDQPIETGEPAATTADAKAPTKANAGRVIRKARGRLAGRARSARGTACRALKVNDHAAAAEGSMKQATARPVRPAGWRIASNNGALLAVACAVVVPLAYWLMARRRRQAVAQGAGPEVRARLRDKASEVTGEVSGWAASAAHSAWPARRP